MQINGTLAPEAEGNRALSFTKDITQIENILDDLKAKNISFSASSMNRDLGGTIGDNTVQNYKRYISRFR